MSYAKSVLDFETINLEENDIRQILRSLFHHEKEPLFDERFLEANVQVEINFKRGNRYEGGLTMCKMHGPGKFVWADGSEYTVCTV